jgi:DNA-binding MarR family transcriptional regulator
MIHKAKSITRIPSDPTLMLSVEDRELFELINKIRDIFLKLRFREVQKDITHYKRAYLLPIIDRLGDNAIPVEIARQLYRKRNTITELLNKMEQDGLILKVKEKSNKKIIKVRLTEEGRKKLKIFNTRSSVHSILSFLKPDELKILENNLTKRKEWLINSMNVTISRYILTFQDDLLIYGLIMDTAHLLDNIIKSKVYGDDLEIDMPRRNVLQYVTVSDNHCTAAAIARSLNKERCTLSKLLTKMEKEGSITRTHNLINKKEILIKITEKGMQQFEDWNKLEIHCKLYNILNSEESTNLRMCLKKVYEKVSSELKYFG